METKRLKIDVPTLSQSYPLLKLNRVDGNRQIIGKNVDALKESILAIGFFGSITITKSGLILDGQHRAKAMEELGQSTIPANILHWVDESDTDLIDKIIIALNNTGKKWSAENFVDIYKNKLTPYHHVHKALLKYKDFTTVNTVTNAVVGQNGLNKQFTSGNAILKKESTYLCLLDNIKWIIDSYGKSNFPALCSRVVIKYVHAHCNDDTALINGIFKEIENAIKEDRLPDGEDSLRDFLDNISVVWEHNFDKKVDPHIDNIKVLSEQIKFKA